MSSPQGDKILAGRVLPRRGAAKRASESFAGQLMSSPARSDDDANRSDYDPGSHPFGESSARKPKNVKYRYQAAGKHLSSPLMGGSASPERKDSAGTQPKLKLKLKPIATPTPPLPLSQPAPSTSKPAIAFKRKASLSPPRAGPPPMSLSCSPLSSVPPSPIEPPKEVQPFPLSPSQATEPASPTRVRASKKSSVSFPSSASAASASKSLSTPNRKKGNGMSKTSLDTWEVGMPVWVLVNQSGVVVGDAIQSNDDMNANSKTDEHMWWPAQIVAKQPLRVSLFGDFPSTSSAQRRTCTITSSSQGNVLSLNNKDGTRRFNRSIFRVSAPHDVSPGFPPSKRQRLENGTSIEDRWEAAVASMDKASALESEGLPALISSYASGAGSFYNSLDDSDLDTSETLKSQAVPSSSARPKTLPRTKSTRRLRAQSSKVPFTPTPRWSPCPPDPTLQIPGELVLAQAPGTGPYYWPGKILSHRPDRVEKYEVKFLDEKVYVLSRKKFWTSEEEGFTTCPLGKWESAIKTTDDPESEDDIEATGETDQDNIDDTSPEPPPYPGKFEALSVNGQLTYVKPVLRAILENAYGPAKAKNAAFMKGGPARAALLKAAGVRGGLDTRFIKAVQRAICRWVLGDSGGRVSRTADQGSNTVGLQDAGDPANPSVPSEPVNKQLPEGDKMECIEETISSGCTQGTEEVAQILPSSEVPSKEGAPENLDSHMVVDRPDEKLQDGLRGEVNSLAAVVPPEGPTASPQLDNHANPCAAEPEQISPSGLVVEPSCSGLSDDHGRLDSRQMGCGEFESLSGVEKLDYCLNVLLPECIQQLLLWRSGARTSTELLSEEEEQQLHDLAARKATETDWVDDVMRLREAQARLRGVDLNKPGSQEQETKIVPGGTRTRPRVTTICK
ncbi:hypothetical protein ID866_3926 [Astraeus odoratus]|nr:hypothetical protein ID866_3926 [Astraeus odoratus]